MDDASTTGPADEVYEFAEYRDGWMANGGFSSYRGPIYDTGAQLHAVDGTLLSIHTYQVDDFVHYLDTAGSCLCGPHVSVYHNDWQDEDVTHVTHVAWRDPVDPDFEPVG